MVGKGRFVADIALPGVRHVALVTCPYPAARIVAIDKAPRSPCRASSTCWTGASSPPRPLPLAGRPRYAQRAAPSAGGRRRALCRRVGRGRGCRYARAGGGCSRSGARSTYERLPFVLDAEEALEPASPPVHADHGSNVLLDRTFVWGEVERDFAASPHRLALRVKWGRSSTVPIETFGVVGELGSVARDPRRLGLDPDAEISRPDRGGAEAAGLGGARALRRRRRRQLRGQARHQAHRARRLPVAPARGSGAPDRGPAGEHARRRRPRAGAAVRRRGRVRRCRRSPRR